jgi:hypothetical protein
MGSTGVLMKQKEVTECIKHPIGTCMLSKRTSDLIRRIRSPLTVFGAWLGGRTRPIGEGAGGTQAVETRQIWPRQVESPTLILCLHLILGTAKCGNLSAPANKIL